jgi:hypothetical protein
MNPCLTLAAALSVAMVSGLCAATDATDTKVTNAPSPAAAAMSRRHAQDELKEVRDRGRLLAHEISDVEDDFYKRYNKVNRNKDYEVFCRSKARLQEGQFRTQTCEPRYAIQRETQYTSGTITMNCGYRGGGLGGIDPYFDGGCAYVTHVPGLNHVSSIVSSETAQQGRTESEARKSLHDGYGAHFKDVVISDSRLFKQYLRLTGLNEKMNETESRYAEIRKAVQGPGKQ